MVGVDVIRGEEFVPGVEAAGRCFNWDSSISVLASAIARFDRAIFNDVRMVDCDVSNAVCD